MILVNLLCICWFVFNIVEEGEVTVGIASVLRESILEFHCGLVTKELRNLANTGGGKQLSSRPVEDESNKLCQASCFWEQHTAVCMAKSPMTQALLALCLPFNKSNELYKYLIPPLLSTSLCVLLGSQIMTLVLRLQCSALYFLVSGFPSPPGSFTFQKCRSHSVLAEFLCDLQRTSSRATLPAALCTSVSYHVSARPW